MSITRYDLIRLTNEQLDKLYTKYFNREAYHMSREGYINSLSTTDAIMTEEVKDLLLMFKKENSKS